MTQIKYAARSAPSFTGWQFFALLVVAALIYAAPARADAPGRIGRIAWLSGTVQLESTASGEVFAAPLNQPLTSGDMVSVDEGSRAEIQIGSKIIRLDAGSVLELDRIDDQQVSVYLANGHAIVELTTPEAIADFTMATANGRFTANDTGTYRFDADANGSLATAYTGHLRFTGEPGGLEIRAGVSAQFWNDGQPHYRLLPPLNDEFAQWSSARNRLSSSGTYTRYVSPEMTGAADLDTYGDWSPTPEYGAVWYPRNVAADWVPYRTGNWVWVAPWGWSWVGHEAWGFAPFHYGRWVQHRGRWGWVPGERVMRPVYAPALVVWIGTPGVTLSRNLGARPNVGWFPLAPREVYVPSYRSSADYVRRVNRAQVKRIDNATLIANSPQTIVQRMRYANREVPRAVTVVPSDVLTQRRPVAPAVVVTRDLRPLRGQSVHVMAPVAVPERSVRLEGRRFDGHETGREAGREADRASGRQAGRPESSVRTPTAGPLSVAPPAASQGVIGTPPPVERRAADRPHNTGQPGRVEIPPSPPARASAALPPVPGSAGQGVIGSPPRAEQREVDHLRDRLRDTGPAGRVEVQPSPSAAAADNQPHAAQARVDRTPPRLEGGEPRPRETATSPPSRRIDSIPAAPAAAAGSAPPEMQRHLPPRASPEANPAPALHGSPRRGEAAAPPIVRPEAPPLAHPATPPNARPVAPPAAASAAGTREGRGEARPSPEAREKRQEERQRNAPGEDGQRQRRGDGERR